MKRPCRRGSVMGRLADALGLDLEDLAALRRTAGMLIRIGYRGASVPGQ